MISKTKTNIILEVKNLKKYFPIQKGFFKRTSGYVKAVDDVSLFIKEGETLGLVGESGSGKTTLGRCILRAVEPTAGEVYFRCDGQSINLVGLDHKSMKTARRNLQMIFQDPYSSLDPRMIISDIIAEPLIANKVLRGKKLRERVNELAELVGLEKTQMRRYPHAFSGGQRQRIGIARALATRPKLIIADEPVSALDVSIQAQILNLMQDLQKEFNLTYLFIAHDLSVVEHISDRVAVMYVGKLIELAETEELYINPLHPYTEALLSAVPPLDPDSTKKRIILPGEVANPADPPPGCYFHPRCNYAKDICKVDTPLLREIKPEHWVSCHFAEKLSLKGVD